MATLPSGRYLRLRVVFLSCLWGLATGCGRLGFDPVVSPLIDVDGGNNPTQPPGPHTPQSDAGTADAAMPDGSSSDASANDTGPGDSSTGDSSTGDSAVNDGSTDTGPGDSGSGDATTDGGSNDAGSDSGTGDAGSGDAGSGDAGADGGSSDSGTGDAGLDAGSGDAGSSDGSMPSPPDIIVVPLLPAEVTEGVADTVTLRMTLQTAPTASVTVGIQSSDTSEGTVSVPSVVFTTMDWSSPHDVLVSSADDVLIDGDQNFDVEILAATSTDMGYNGMDPNDVTFINHDDEINRPFRISTTSMGGQITAAAQYPEVSGNGRFVIYQSTATDIVTGDTNSRLDVFLYDRSTGNTERVSRGAMGAQGNHDSREGAVSEDGRYVAFTSRASNFVAGDTNNSGDVFVLDRTLDTIELVSKSTAGTLGDSASDQPSISSDGRYVAFRSSATNLVAGDTNGFHDVFLRDRTMSTTIKVTEALGGGNTDGASQTVDMDNGTYIGFETNATNMATNDSNGLSDIFVYEIATGITTLLSASAPDTTANGLAMHARTSPDGSWTAFSTFSSNIMGGLDNDSWWDVHIYENGTGTRDVASLTESGTKISHISQFGVPSNSGDRVVFLSNSTNVVTGPDTNGVRDLFFRDRSASTTTRVMADGGAEPDGTPFIPDISGDGTVIVFSSNSTNMVAGDTNGVEDIFIYQAPQQ